MAGDRYSNPTLLSSTPEHWTVNAIEDLCETVTSGGTPLRSNSSFYQSGIHSWFKTQELNDSVLSQSEERITDKALALSSAKLFPKHTVLMAMYGDGKTITSLGILSREAATNQACCAMIPNREVCQPKFLFYALKYHRQDFIRIASGGAQRNLSGKLIRRFAIDTPPLQEQRAIAWILGTLDDKIELNRRMNETLEAIARAIFKSWFVDFDPVRAKSEKRKPEVPKNLADAFPASFVHSELGDVPEGFRVGPFRELVEPVRDQENPFESPETLFRHFSIPAYDEGQWPRDELGATIMSQKSRVQPGAVLLSKLNPEIERVWLVDVEATDRAVCSTEFLVLRPRPPYRRAFVYCMARSPVLRQQIESLVTGTSKSHQRAPAEAILSLHVILPPNAIAEEFERIAAPLLDRILASRRESRALAAMRDTLLPKLISGELRVKAALETARER